MATKEKVTFERNVLTTSSNRANWFTGSCHGRQGGACNVFTRALQLLKRQLPHEWQAGLLPWLRQHSIGWKLWGGAKIGAQLVSSYLLNEDARRCRATNNRERFLDTNIRSSVRTSGFLAELRHERLWGESLSCFYCHVSFRVVAFVAVKFCPLPSVEIWTSAVSCGCLTAE